MLSKALKNLFFNLGLSDACIVQDYSYLSPDLRLQYEELTQSALAGEVYAMMQLGSAYYEGRDLKNDYDQAYYWFNKAANAGNGQADLYLGIMHSEGLGLKVDHEKAFKYWSKALEKNIYEAFYYLGSAFLRGLGVERNVEHALLLLKKADSYNMIDAAYVLGIIYREGRLVGENHTFSHRLLSKAAAAGHGEAKRVFGISCAELSLRYRDGSGNIAINRNKSEKMALQALENNVKPDYFTVGIYHYRNTRMPDHKKAAFNWFFLGAREGEPKAMALLAIMYAEGYGVAKRDRPDYEKALSIVSSFDLPIIESYNETHARMRELLNKLSEFLLQSIPPEQREVNDLEMMRLSGFAPLTLIPDNDFVALFESLTAGLCRENNPEKGRRKQS